ncbi:MAG: DUF11 domain-containing protein [Anaerolineales bacterium]|nr:DUF11 domain-containing protein [Anaerolineales bacterium]
MISSFNVWRRVGVLTAVLLFSAVFSFTAVVQTLYAADETVAPEPTTDPSQSLGVVAEETTPTEPVAPAEVLAADLSESAKMVDLAQATAGQTLHYSIVLTNSDDVDFANVVLTDTLPAGLMLVDNSISITGAQGNPVSGTMGNVLTVSNLVVFPNSPVNIMYNAVVSEGVMVGDMLTNTAVFHDALNPATTYTRTAVTEIISATASFTGSTKTVDETGPRAGETVNYTVVVHNSGDLNVQAVDVVDTLPAGLSLTGTPLSSGGGTFDTSDPQELLWTGPVDAFTAVTLTYSAQVGNNIEPGTVLTNSVMISGGGADAVTRDAAVEVVPSVYYLNLPLVSVPLPVPTVANLQSSRPNSANSWTLTWDGQDAEFYEIQESRDPNFSDVVTYQVNEETYTLTKDVTYRNVYYYRARGVNGSQMSDWSNAVEVIGGYYDEFENADSGWAIRRTTFLEEVFVLYEKPPVADDSWLVIISADRWDWGIASPLMPAPEPPYAIEFRGKSVRPGNLTSGGPVFAGDWNGDPDGCINYDTLESIYEHDDCFNQFYFINNIWFGNLKAQWERIDQVVWCPSCGNSPSKRGREDWSTHPVISLNLGAGEDDGWNEYRLEVRENEIKYYVNGRLQYVDGDDVRYTVQNRYFGVGVTTDEYQPSVWRFDYYSVMPMDN